MALAPAALVEVVEVVGVPGELAVVAVEEEIHLGEISVALVAAGKLVA